MSILRTAGKQLRRLPIPPLDWLERRWIPSGTLPTQTHLPFVAVVGPPRVGSTLMYQLLLTQFRFAFFDNLQHGLLRYPNLAFSLSHWLRPIHLRTSTLASDHGFVHGILGASEANFFWPYWCGMNMTQCPVVPNEARLGHVLAFFNRMHEQLQLPLTNSYNAHAFYMKEVSHIFPRSVFIVLRRDPLANGLSILRARQKLRRRVQEWWSIQPSQCVGIAHLDEYTQIARQLRYTYQSMRNQKQTIPQLNTIDVAYEDLCRNPRAELERIAAMCRESGVEIVEQAESSLPICPAKHISSPIPSGGTMEKMFRALELEGLGNDVSLC